MNKNDDSIVLSELNSNNCVKPSIQVEHALADIKDTFQTPMLAKIPFDKIAAIGGAFAALPNALMTPAGEGIYRCVFPNGISGTLALAKDGSGALGTIINKAGIAGQARWIPVEASIGPAVMQTVIVAVAILGAVKMISDIKDGQKEIVGILERDKKSQLLADYDILSTYMDDYRYYWENDADVIVNLNQVKNIKRNAQKDIRSYKEQIENMLNAKKNLLKIQPATQKTGSLLDRFVHYKLAIYVCSLAEYMEVMLAKNFQKEYLDKVAQELRDYSTEYKTIYTRCYDKIGKIKKEAFTSQATDKLADISKTMGSTIEKIPIISKGPVDELLLGLGDLIDEAEEKQLKKTLEFFIQYKDSGIAPVVEHIDTVNHIANQPTVILYDNSVICFQDYQRELKLEKA